MIYPIILGESIKDKEIRLDINVMLNNQSIINLEMQVCRDRIEYHQDIHNYQRFTAQQKQIILEKDNTIAENSKS